MFTRLRHNVSTYPRVFRTWVIASVVFLIGNYIAYRWTGISNRLAVELLGLAIVPALVLDGIAYFYIFTNPGRTQATLRILDLAEGRQPETVDEEENENG